MTDLANQPNFSTGSLAVTASTLGGSLMQLLMADDITPGADPSYELCKTIFLYHPLGRKMAESPIIMAQSLPKKRVVQAAPDDVRDEFEKCWTRLRCESLIANVMRLSRIYGIASVIAVVDDGEFNTPLDLPNLWQHKLNFNVLDPLNTAGSLVLSQIPTSPDFNKPVSVMTMGKTVHPTRFEVVMNEEPIYIAYTASAFGFVGRSVYQRALFPLKSFVRSMLADDMIAMKLALLVAKQKRPGSIIDQVMSSVAGLKRSLLQQAQTGNILSIDTEEAIETLNMQNADGAGMYSRTNIIKNVATAADMPAKLLDNETLVAGFGEGTEDAKNIVRYIDSVRCQMDCLYTFFERITRYYSWTPDFFEIIKTRYPEQYGNRTFESAFSEWSASFQSEWPSLLIEPESDKVKVEDVKLQATVAVAQTLMGELDPQNKAALIQWVTDNVSENRRLFPHSLDFDTDELEAFQEERANQPPPPEEQSDANNMAKKFGRFA